MIRGVPPKKQKCLNVKGYVNVRCTCPASACYCRDIRHKKQATILSYPVVHRYTVVPHLTRSSNVVSWHRNNVAKSSYQAHIHSRGVRERKAEMRSFVLVVTTSPHSSGYATIESLKMMTYAQCPGVFAWKTRIGTVKYSGHYDDITELQLIRKPVETDRLMLEL